MKKILLGTTALIAMGLVSGQAAAADKIALGLGGFMNQYVVHADTDRTGAANDNKGLTQYSDSEVHFKGSTTLDNGLTVAVKAELEVDKGSDARQTDVVTVTVSSDTMGQVLLGSDVNAAWKMANAAPAVGPNDMNDVYGWASTAATGAVGIEGIDTRGSSNKNQKIRYISPSFSGASVAVSHTPSSAANNDSVGASGLNATTDTTRAETAYALAYSSEMSGVGIEFDVSRTNREDNSDITRGGLVLAMGGLTVGGSYAEQKDNIDATSTAQADTKAWDLGVGYATGPYSFAVSYMKAELDTNATNNKDEESTTWRVGGSYDMGAGVSLVGQYSKGKLTDDTTTLTDGNNPSVFIAGIEVAF